MVVIKTAKSASSKDFLYTVHSAVVMQYVATYSTYQCKLSSHLVNLDCGFKYFSLFRSMVGFKIFIVNTRAEVYHCYHIQLF